MKCLWAEPQPVGQTVELRVLLYSAARRPISLREDALFVGITHTDKNVAVTPVVMPAAAPRVYLLPVRVQFRVLVAGTYNLCVLYEGQHAIGSPSLRPFIAGPLDPGRLLLRRPQGSLLWASLHAERHLTVVARDQFDNTVSAERVDTQAFSVVVRARDADQPVSPGWEHVTVANDDILITLTPNAAGVFDVSVYFSGNLLTNGSFTYVVLNDADSAVLRRSVESGSNIRYDVLRTQGVEGLLPHPENVEITISNNRITLQRRKRARAHVIATMCISPATVLDPVAVVWRGAVPRGGAFTLSDGAGGLPPITLWSRQRDLILATTAHFASFCEDAPFEEKLQKFAQEIKKKYSGNNTSLSTVVIERSNIVFSSFLATQRFKDNGWKKQILVRFKGETGVDGGGLRREWFCLVSEAMFSASFGLFGPLSPGCGLLHPNHAGKRPPYLNLKHFKFAGKFVGKCLVEGALSDSFQPLLHARFTRSFLTQLCGKNIQALNFMEDDPDFYQFYIKYIQNNNLNEEDIIISFTDAVEGFGTEIHQRKEFKPGGADIRVTNENKEHYLECLAQWRLVERCRPEVEAFRRGLATLIPEHLLYPFDADELEMLMCGSDNISVSDWRLHSVVRDVDRQTLEWFWTALSNMSNEERGMVLQFATGNKHLPAGGFGKLNPQFHIVHWPARGALPSARTCFNQLYLPAYDSYGALQRALALAVTEGGSFQLV